MMRYINELVSKDFSLVNGMMPLGSCTMKLNASSELMPVSWPEFSNVHPFTPKEQTIGYQEIIKNLKDWLCDITGFADEVCNQMQDLRVNMQVYLQYKRIIKAVGTQKEMYV